MLLSCSLYGFFSSCGNGAVIQHRAETHPVAGWCVVATLCLVGQVVTDVREWGEDASFYPVSCSEPS